MTSLSMVFGSSAVLAATAAKNVGGSKKEKGPFDWIIGGLMKEDQFFETDPILNKKDDKTSGGGGTTGTGKSSVAVPPKKKNGGGFGGLGGLFAKKD